MEEEVKGYYDHNRCVPVIDPYDPEYQIKLDQRIRDFDHKRDSKILNKIRNPISTEQYLKDHPDDIENRAERTENWTFEGLARKGRELIRKRELEERLRELEELEEERLDYNGRPGMIRYLNWFGRIVSASRIAPYC